MTVKKLSDVEIKELIESRRQPAICMLHTSGSEDEGTPGCWFGGDPTLPPEIDWPVYKHRDTGTVIPLTFLAQINLDHLPRVPGLPPLPETGTLFVFYEWMVAQLVGIMDDSQTPPLQSGEAVRVIYVDHDVSVYPERCPPKRPDLSEIPEDELSEGYEPHSPGSWAYHEKEFIRYTRWPFNFVIVDTDPSPGCNNPFPGQDLPGDCLSQVVADREKQTERLQDLQSGGDPERVRYPSSFSEHRIFGMPQAQTMPRAEEFTSRWERHWRPITEDHVLLFRFDVDRIGHSSLDAYSEAFWIKRADLEAENFDDIIVWGDG